MRDLDPDPVSVIIPAVQLDADVDLIIRDIPGQIRPTVPEDEPQFVKTAARGADPVLQPAGRFLAELRHVPGAGQEVRGPPEITEGIEVRAAPQGKGLDRADFVAGFRAIRAHTAVVVFNKDTAPAGDMHIIRTSLDTFSTRRAGTTAVQPVFPNRVSKARRRALDRWKAKIMLITQVHNPP
jgi:hypothetical protein